MYEQLNTEFVKREHRDYLGLSEIGENCYRYLQYNHYWAYERNIDTRIERLFNVGKAAEPTMIYDLATIGLVVTMQQLEVVGLAGHWKGHIDGLVHNVHHYAAGDRLWEAKTHAEKFYVQLERKGVEVAFPVHYDQVIGYMGYM